MGIALVLSISRATFACGTISKHMGIFTFLVSAVAFLLCIVTLGSFMGGCYDFLDDMELQSSDVETDIGTGAACWVVCIAIIFFAGIIQGYEVFAVTNFSSIIYRNLPSLGKK